MLALELVKNFELAFSDFSEHIYGNLSTLFLTQHRDVKA